MSTISSLNSSTTQQPDYAQIQQSLFNQADANGDGSISTDELQGLMAKNPRLAKALSSLAPTTDGSAPTAADIMKKLDTTGDGTVSADEFKAGLTQARANMKAHRGHHHGSGSAGDSDGDQDGSGSASSTSNESQLQSLLQQFLTALQNGDSPTDSTSSADSSSPATSLLSGATPSPTDPNNVLGQDNNLADLLTQILAKMKQPNGYGQNGSTNTASASSAAILQTSA